MGEKILIGAKGVLIMLYLNDNDIKKTGIDWSNTIDVIVKAAHCLETNDYAQPIKPYLRYGDMKNRIIAMPAYVGGEFNSAGIKWIASFPDNIKKYGVQRAHSVTVLNEHNTGKPFAIFNTALVSIIRTASVTGSVIANYFKYNNRDKLTLGIIGFGPIGQAHLKMAVSQFGERIDNIRLYDLNGIKKENIPTKISNTVTICENWEDVYNESDIFITCTTSTAPYIDKKPKKKALLLNVSLRDFKNDILQYINNKIIVDDWQEVCRESTDIERFYLAGLLDEKDTVSIADVLCRNAMTFMDMDEPIMFNPMGMAVFDIAIAYYLYEESKLRGIGTVLE